MKAIAKKYFKPAIFIALFFFMFFFMIKSTAQGAEVPKALYYSRGALVFFTLIFILRKVSWKRFEVWGTLIAGTAIIAIFFLYKGIRPSTYGIDGFRAEFYKFFLLAVTVSLIVEVIFRWKKNGTGKGWNLALLVFLGIGAVLAGIFDRSTIIPLTCISLALLCTDIKEKEWAELVNCFAVGYYAAFVTMMVLSFTVYSGNRQHGRLLGAFLNVDGAGIFCGGALLCALYFLVKYVQSQDKKLIKFLVPIAMIIFSIGSMLAISSRSALFGVFLSALGIFVFMHGKKDKRVTIKRALIALAIAFVMLLAVVIGTVFLYRVFIKGNADFDLWDDSHFYSYILNRIYLTMNSSKDENMYFDSRILNMLNYFTSARLEIWAKSMPQIGFIGHEYQYVESLGITQRLPHNFYIFALIRYGWVGAGCIFVWLLLYLVNSLKRVLSGDKGSILPAIWIIYCVAMFISTCASWASPVFFGMLFLQYPMARNLGKENP